MPTSAVKITSDITRGFSNAKKSRAVPGLITACCRGVEVCA